MKDLKRIEVIGNINECDDVIRIKENNLIRLARGDSGYIEVLTILKAHRGDIRFLCAEARKRWRV